MERLFGARYRHSCTAKAMMGVRIDTCIVLALARIDSPL
jgi:hypothetical protein